MKEIELHTSDKTKLRDERQIEKKSILTGSEVLRSGHRCFEINTITLDVKEAEYSLEVQFSGKTTRKITMRRDCVYVNALNKKNALKVYHKGGREVVKPFLSL